MLLRTARVAFGGLSLGLVCAAAGACRSNFNDDCERGTLGCECLAEEACVAGLSCYEGLCASVNGDTESGEAETGSEDVGEADSGDGDGDGQNLFGDPGFESWPAGNSALWDTSESTLTQDTQMVFAGRSAALFDSPSYGAVGQILSFSPPIGGDVCLLVSAQMAYQGGDGTPPAILMSGTNDEDEMFLAGDPVSWVTDGDWHQVQVVIVPVGTVSLGSVIFSAPADAQSWWIDDASASRVPCP